LHTLIAAGDPRLEAGVVALVEQVHRGAIKRLALEKVDSEPALGSELGGLLLKLGFQEGPRRLTLSA
jgi:ATP-dependent Lhr-like helicase